MRNILIGQSGGPTSVMNASLVGLIDAAKKAGIKGIYGALNGIEGIIDNQIIDLMKENEDELNYIVQTPGAILGSIRYKLPSYELNKNIYEKIKNVFIKYQISKFYYIGGNDSMDTCLKLTEYFQKNNFPCVVIGIPKTIDNDLMVTDYTPGYPSALRYVATTIMEIFQDVSSYKTGRVTIVEVMGRDTGWLAAAGKLAQYKGSGPDFIYVPEVAFDLNKFLESITKVYNEKKKVFVVVAEGLKDKDGNYLQEVLPKTMDSFGHLQFGGISKILIDIIDQRLNLPVRSVELNLSQRAGAHLTSLIDIDNAFIMGKYAINVEITGKMVTIIRDDSNDFTYGLTDLELVANKVKKMPLCFINDEMNNIDDKFIAYGLPLIDKGSEIEYENGLPRYGRLNKIFVE